MTQLSTAPAHVKVGFYSDAHLFNAGFSEEATRRTLERLEHALANNSLLVLNGDIFELPFSELGFARTTARAMAVLEIALAEYPDKEVNYVIGNHDGDKVFVHELYALSQRYPNLRVTEKHFLIDHILVTHGDLVQEKQIARKTDFPNQLSLGKTASDIQARIQHWLKGADRTKFQPHLWVQRIEKYFLKHDPELLAQATEVITGHTHVPFEKFVYHGKTYRNTGTMFDEDTYYPIERTVTQKAFEDYLAQEQPQEPEKKFKRRARKAIERVEEYRAQMLPEIREIAMSDASFVNRLMLADLAYRLDADKGR